MATDALSPSAPGPAVDWVESFFRDADSFHLPNLVAWFADNVEVRFGNQPAIRGKAPAEEAFRNFWETIDGMRHRREAVVLFGDVAAQMSIVTYVRKDGGEVSMPVASHLRRCGDRQIDRLWIYIDMAPLFSAAI